MRNIPLAGFIQGQEEIDAVNRILKSDWHVSGPECTTLQNELAAYHGVKYCVVVNSGSSANLLALQCLNLPKGSRVLTAACGFPATLNPIIHLGLRPILVDYDLNTLNIDLIEMHRLLDTYPNTRAMILAHTLGNALEMDEILSLAQKYDVKLIEDCCEAVGTKYKSRCVGSFGDIGTISFYSSHQINGMGMGGALLTNSIDIYEHAKSLRDWGKQEVREGQIYTKMNAEIDGIPYDQQYTYNTVGYNMRMPDANCAYAREQLTKLPAFVKKRKENYTYLHSLLEGVEQLIPSRTPNGGEPSYFGYPLVLNTPTVGLRDRFVEHLENNGVHVRLFFAGNILRHEPYHELVYDSINDEFPTADYLMHHACFCGCWPGLSLEDMEYIADTIKVFFK